MLLSLAVQKQFEVKIVFTVKLLLTPPTMDDHDVATQADNHAEDRAQAPTMPFEPQTIIPSKIRPSLNKFVLYETKTVWMILLRQIGFVGCTALRPERTQRFFIIGSNQSDDKYRVLKIDRTSPKELVITEDNAMYSRQEIQEVLLMIEDGNRSTGGLHKVISAYGLVGEYLLGTCNF
jgi:hypothetical protein